MFFFIKKEPNSDENQLCKFNSIQSVISKFETATKELMELRFTKNSIESNLKNLEDKDENFRIEYFQNGKRICVDDISDEDNKKEFYEFMKNKLLTKLEIIKEQIHTKEDCLEWMDARLKTLNLEFDPKKHHA